VLYSGQGEKRRVFSYSHRGEMGWCERKSFSMAPFLKGKRKWEGGVVLISKERRFFLITGGVPRERVKKEFLASKFREGREKEERTSHSRQSTGKGKGKGELAVLRPRAPEGVSIAMTHPQRGKEKKKNGGEEKIRGRRREGSSLQARERKKGVNKKAVKESSCARRQTAGKGG